MATETLEYVAPAKERAGVRLGDDHFAGAKAGTFRDLRLRKIDQACFRPDDQEAIVGERVAHGAKAVAIEFCSYVLPIGKNERGRAIPGFALQRERGQSATHVAG